MTKTSFDVCSDLHLEFDIDYYGDVDRSLIESLFKKPSSDNLIVAGDVLAVPTRDEQSRKYVDDVLTLFNDIVGERYKNAIFVLGNHDTWYHPNRTIDEYKETVEYWTNKLTNFNVLDIFNNPVTKIDDVTIIGSTGWTEIDPCDRFWVQQNMNDYYHTEMTADFTNDIAKKTRETFEQLLNDHNNDKVVVVTHHAPMKKCEFLHKSVPAAYLNSWEKLLDNHPNIATWVYGHVHQRYQFMYNKTNVVCNARGYIGNEAIANNFHPLMIAV